MTRIIRNRSQKNHSKPATPQHQPTPTLPHAAWLSEEIDWQRDSLEARRVRYQNVQVWLTQMVANDTLTERLFRACVRKDEDYGWSLQDSGHTVPPTLGWMIDYPELFAKIDMRHEAFLRHMLMTRRAEYFDTWSRLGTELVSHPRVINTIPTERRWQFFEEFARQFHYNLWRLEWKTLDVDPQKLRDLWWQLMREVPNTASYLWWGGEERPFWDLFTDDNELISILRFSIDKGVEDSEHRRKDIAKYFAFRRRPELLHDAIEQEVVTRTARYPNWQPQREVMASWHMVREQAINRALSVVTALLAA